ncbi:Na+/solute symporter [Halococcus morrhuae DSM 1307]|uniref:Na+/solute symporter n=1 Tax=Halococcus morrhuae DSM 1307 TaxID=931277 RepID=M0M4U0_HALMO|nr:sodium:solute symporter family protein [Halococcus morrhuae]EMA40711.1 Na+/solute symporter [Halococcus morrhuae DSM 1307]
MVSTDTLFIAGIPLLYLAFALWIGLRSRGEADQDTTEGYVAGGRGIGLLVMYFVMSASINSAFAFLGGPGWSFSKGAAALYIVAYGGFGMLLWYIFGPKVARLGRKRGYVTQAGFLSDRYNSKYLSVLMAIASVAAFIPYLVVQIKGVAFILTEASNGLIPFWLSGLLPFLVIAIYVLTSGMMGVGWSNVLQGIMMLVLAWFLGLYLPFEIHGGVQPMFEQIANSNPSHLLVGLPQMSMLRYSSFIIVSALGFVMWPHLFMRAYSADSEKTLKKTVALYPTFQFVLIPILLIGYAGVTMVDPAVLSSPDRILPYMITELGINPILIGLFFAGALAATMSTADSILHASVSVTARDFYKPLFGSDISEKSETRLMKLAVFPTVGVAYYFALFSPINIVPLQAAAYGAVVQFLPLMLGALYWPSSTKAGAVSGLFAGTIVTALFTFFVPSPLNLHAGFWGLIVTTVVFVAVSLVTEVEDREFAQEVIRESRPTPSTAQTSSESSSVTATDGGTQSDEAE